jgi:hypothetical protein
MAVCDLTQCGFKRGQLLCLRSKVSFVPLGFRQRLITKPAVFPAASFGEAAWAALAEAGEAVAGQLNQNSPLAFPRKNGTIHQSSAVLQTCDGW